MSGMLHAVFAHGGPIIWLILAASTVALTVIIERLVHFWGQRRRFMAAWRQCADQLRSGDTVVLLGDEGLGMARMLKRGLEQRGRDAEFIRTTCMEAAQREVSLLERHLSILATVAQVCPLLGLLGTVSGLMHAFAAAEAGGVHSGTLAGGLYQALGTTAAGLAVAIPAYVAYSFLAGYVGRLSEVLEQAAGELPLLMEQP